MKLTNSTNYPDYVLRRMVSWCCKQLDIPVKSVRNITFRNSTRTSGVCYSARGEIIIRLQRAQRWTFEEMNQYAIDRAQKFRTDRGHLPYTDPVHVIVQIGPRMHGGGAIMNRDEATAYVEKLNADAEPCRLRALVGILAHEVAHRANYLHGSTTRDRKRKGAQRRVGGGSEKQTRAYERKLKAAFDADRLALIAEWFKPLERNRKEPKPRQQLNHERTLAALERWERKLKLAQTKVKQYKHRVRYYERAAAKRGES